jgi:hypothetical protein
MPALVSKRPNAIMFLLVLISLVGMGLVLYATTWGPIIYSDSVGYLSVAQNILVGKGVGVYEVSGRFSPSTLQPPFFSMLLAFFGLTGIDIVTLSRWLHGIFFGIVLFLIGLSLLRLAGSRLFALAGALTFSVSPLLLHLFSLVMTEPTFILLSVSAALCLLRAVGRDHLGWLAASAMCVGLAVITRLVGAAWIVSGALVALVFWSGGWKRRLITLFCYAGLSSLPVVAWGVWTQWIVQAPSRIAEAGVGPVQRLIEARVAMVDIFWSWLPFSALLPDVHYRIKMLGLLTLPVLSVGWVVWAVGRATRNQPGYRWQVWLQEPIIRAVSLLWLSLVAYLGVIVVGYAFSSPTPDLNERTLAMGLLIGLSVTFVTCGAVFRFFSTHRWRYMLPLACAGVLIASALPQSLPMLQVYHQEGSGYLGSHWRMSPTRMAATELPADIPLISNEHSMLTFWLGRPVYPLPEIINLKLEPLDVLFGENADDEVQQVFRQQGAALVIFDTIRWQFDALYFEQTPERLDGMLNGLKQYSQHGDGAIYFYPLSTIHSVDEK